MKSAEIPARAFVTGDQATEAVEYTVHFSRRANQIGQCIPLRTASLCHYRPTRYEIARGTTWNLQR